MLVIEREGLIDFGGEAATVIGPDLEVGDRAPEFTVHKLDWSLFSGLKDTQGKTRIVASVPSLDTSVCNREALRLDQEADTLGEDLMVMVISTDLPFAQGRWAKEADVSRIAVLSDHLEADFGKKYGCLLKDQRILRRAIFVIDPEDQIVYADYMPTLGDEPEYLTVFEAAKNSLGRE